MAKRSSGNFFLHNAVQNVIPSYLFKIPTADLERKLNKYRRDGTFSNNRSHGPGYPLKGSQGITCTWLLPHQGGYRYRERTYCIGRKIDVKITGYYKALMSSLVRGVELGSLHATEIRVVRTPCLQGALEFFIVICINCTMN